MFDQGGTQGSDRHGAARAVDHQFVFVRDLDASRGFYERLGGRAEATYEDESVGLRAVLVRFPHGTPVELLELNGGGDRAGSPAPVRVAVKRARPGARGVHLIADPDGNAVELVAACA